MIDTEQMRSYTNTLENLKNQVSSAEKEIIVAETNHKNLVEKRDNLIKECEAFIGTSFSQAPALLKQHEDELEKLMQALSPIDVSGPISEDTIKSLKAVADEFGIPFTLKEE